MMDYCPTCGYPFDENGRCHCPDVCPCCGNDPKTNCVYDTPEQRHLKNLMNDKPDEAWVVKARTQTNQTQQGEPTYEPRIHHHPG